MLDQTSSESMIQNSVSVVDSLSASQNSSINTVICTSSSEKIREGSSCPLFAQVVYLTSDGEEENDLGESFDDDLGGDDQNDGKNSGSSSRKYYGQSELSSKSSPKVMRRSVEEEEEEKDVRKKEEGKDGEDGEERGGKQEEKEKNGHNCGNSISRNHDDHNGHSRSYNPNYDGSNDVTECDQELKKNCGSWQDIFNSFNTTTIATTTTSNPPHFSHHHHHHPHPHHNSSTHRCEQNFSSSLCHSSCASSPSSSLPSSASLSSTGQYQSHHTESFLHSHSNSDPHHHSHRNHHQYSSASDGDNPECAISSSFSLPSSSCCEKDEGHFGSSNIDSIGYHERICNSMDRDFEKNENESSKDGESCEDIDGEEEDEEECSDDQERRNCISHQEHDQDEDKMSIRITPANVYFDCPPLTELLETIVEEDEDQISTSSSSSSSSSASSIPCPQSASQFTTSPINSHHIHSQSEEEILSPGEENDQQTEPHAHCHHHIHHQYPIHQPPPPPPPPHQRSGSHHQLHLHSQSAIQHPHHHQHQQQQQQQLSFDQHQQQQQQQQIQGLPGHIGGSRTVSQPLQQQQHQQSGSLLSQSTCLSSPPPPIHHSHHTHTHSQQQQQPLISQLSTSVQIHQPPQVPPPPTLRSQTIGGLFDPARSEFFSSLTPDSDDSDMTGIIKGPQYKARAPKNIWSPGSTTSSSSDLSPPGATLGPITTASATQTTPTRNDTHIKPSQPDGLPAGFRPVKLSTSTSASAIGTGGGANREASMPGTSDGGTTTTGGDAYITPSSPSEISLPDGGSKMRSESPMMGDGGGGSSSGDRKYWTLPRSHHQHRSGANVSAPYTGAPATFNGQMGDPSSMTRDDDDIVSSLAHEGVQRVITDKAPPANAKFLFESPTTKFYTLPTSQTSSRILHHHLPPPPKCEGIGPVNEAGVPLTLRTGVKDEFGSDWYKSMFRRLHKSDRPRSEADQPIHIHRVRSDRSRDRFDPDYHSEDESSRYLPRHISEYEPGRSSIAYRERDKTQEAASKRSQEHQSTSQDTDNQNGIRPHEMDKPYRHPIQRSDSHHKNCVFNALATNGYESDSSYIIRKKEHPTVPTPASRSTYCAIQRGDMDIPLSGLQKPAPAPRAHKVGEYTYSPQNSGWKPTEAPEPPKRPPTPSKPSLQMSDIDNWHKQINDDLNYIYETLDRPKSKQSSSKPISRSMTVSNIGGGSGVGGGGSTYQPPNSSIGTKSITPTSGYGGGGGVHGDIGRISSPSVGPPRLGTSTPSMDHHRPIPIYHTASYNRAAYSGSPSSSVEINFPSNVQQQQSNSLKRSSSWVDRSDRFVRNVNYDDLGGDESPHRFDEREVNIHYKTPIQQLVKSSDHFNEDDLVKFQRDVLQRYQDNEHERRLNKEAQRRHHFTPTQEHIIHLDRYQKAYAQKGETPRILARVLFDFHALSGREISIKKGDIVIITQPIDHNWVEIEDSQSGLKGLVPRNYLDYDQEGVAKALFDFQGKTSVEISFQKDEMLKVTRKVDDNWFEGVNEQGRSGIFPCSYVEMLKTPLYLQLNNNDFISSPSPRADSSLSRPHSASHILSPVRPSSPIRHVNGTRSKDLFELANPGRHTKHYRAIYPYKPQQMDELELIPGDILNVTMHCDDGWFVGHSTITGQFGTFPGNYVEPFM
ncbi:uncharacterized protein LOC141848957 isoform X2 [Brevipalpus obovatus]|uniref:uncharacterized protein LOC141848957 isoform X2 n=1 Tax=Brevipalpus obovatus TaxID=246614 RepID=UPI003D9EB326